MNHNPKTNDFGLNSIIPTCCHQGNLPRIAHKNRIWRRLLRAAKRAGYIIYIAAPLIVAVPVAWLFGKSHPKLEDKVSTFAHHARARARTFLHIHTRAHAHTHTRARRFGRSLLAPSKRPGLHSSNSHSGPRPGGWLSPSASASALSLAFSLAPSLPLSLSHPHNYLHLTST